MIASGALKEGCNLVHFATLQPLTYQIAHIWTSKSDFLNISQISCRYMVDNPIADLHVKFVLVYQKSWQLATDSRFLVALFITIHLGQSLT